MKTITSGAWNPITRDDTYALAMDTSHKYRQLNDEFQGLIEQREKGNIWDEKGGLIMGPSLALPIVPALLGSFACAGVGALLSAAIFLWVNHQSEKNSLDIKRFRELKDEMAHMRDEIASQNGYSAVVVSDNNMM